MEADQWTRRDVIKLSAMAGVSLFVSAEALPADSSRTIVFESYLEAKLEINGQQHRMRLDPRQSLLDLLRETMGLTGTKKGCDHGQCGACTVLIGGKRALSCLTFAASVEGRPVTTIEGISDGDELHPMQTAFIRHDGLQCGYCTPGQIMSAIGMLKEGAPKDVSAIREGMAGNLCRCGAYNGIVDAIREVAHLAPAGGAG